MSSIDSHSLTPEGPAYGSALAVALGHNVSRLRIEQNISKQTFALMVGIGRPLLNRIENGTADPRLSLIIRLADALSVTPEDLLALSL
ncbi:helix-turn-helix transcriptional regulator [Eggerthellaceae bacterium zg-1084]|uniref:Helix-turn-helix transcriptional regulator n=1 Tax=Berryella wangjianweii TaxID=2734634 RepID=A0A6M8J241_9ACTN|nr:helix-turn-helix transcriptional regulator [Berryella wangjianweii]NPD30911.1 helix-turn-helix transcriptional regulator [Berryella wangjianweii]NPD31776.1 helix-turn-helix transcriptional regulator [Eggerthellaceae bacterium zg-997]QKF07627.1 helix-turn-helix transcriptional regulator [Berryella wangjianweii]